MINNFIINGVHICKKGRLSVPFLDSVFVQLLARQSAETLVEFVDTATGAHLTLLTSVEWVTFVTHIQVDVFTHS
ncbi:hypothetical protein EA58_16035 [Photobacterium galatheae]|uniref:Uncharacterized protein n=1 Tax=Photobacterium galatheae TaxID=1654360 RepID=A0A066RJM2_9GAMM|nr:hypothetical protein EA58_16035 [Photobacterium galatheae]